LAVGHAGCGNAWIGCDVTLSSQQPASARIVVVMGVAGSGKTTIASLLADRLQWDLADADSFHPAPNIDKMSRGIPLTDEDRWPWLRAIAAWIDAEREAGRHAVVTCSALKRRYRDVIVGARDDVRLVYLKGDYDLIAQRMLSRHGHFMPVALLRNQFEDLEEPTSDERPIVVTIDRAPPEIVAEIVRSLGLAS